MTFKTIQTHVGFTLILGCASLLSACGGDDKKKVATDYSPLAAVLSHQPAAVPV